MEMEFYGFEGFLPDHEIQRMILRPPQDQETNATDDLASWTSVLAFLQEPFLDFSILETPAADVFRLKRATLKSSQK